MANKHMKDAPPQMSLGKGKLKQFYYMPVTVTETTHRLQQMLTKMWRDEKSDLFLVAMPNRIATSEETLVFSYKTKCTFTTRSSNHTLWYLPQGVEELCPLKCS